MKKVAVLPFNEYDKMKCNTTSSMQNPHTQPTQSPPYAVQSSLQIQPSHQHHFSRENQQPLITGQIHQQTLPYSLLDPKVEQINNYEKEVYRILNSDIKIHEKRILYQDAMQKLLSLKELHLKGPLIKSDVEETNLPQEVKPEVKCEDNLRNILEESLPNRSRKSGLTLYNILKEQITWNELGQIIIDDEAVSYTHLTLPTS